MNMKIFKNNYFWVGVIVLFISFIAFNINNPKCYGDECFASEEVKIYEVYKEMNPSNLVQKAESAEVFLLDVREKFEWEEGYIKGASHLALGDINEETILNLPKDRPIYIYCRSGRRAEEAKNKILNLGFSDVSNIGGINDWLERGGELVR